MLFYHVFLFLFKHYLCVFQYLRERGEIPGATPLTGGREVRDGKKIRVNSFNVRNEVKD